MSEAQEALTAEQQVKVLVLLDKEQQVKVKTSVAVLAQAVLAQLPSEVLVPQKAHLPET
jgi:imidazoleglycerol phosphate dehydratase HisB